MSKALNRIVKRTLQNEARRQTQKRTTPRRARSAVAGGAGTILVNGQSYPSLSVGATGGAMVAVQNVGRLANAVYAPAASGGSVFVAGVGGGGGSAGGGGTGPTYVAGNGIQIIGVEISAKHRAGGGLTADAGGSYLIVPALSGLTLDVTGLRVGAGDGIDVNATTVAVDVTDLIAANGGLGEDAGNNLLVKLDPVSGLTLGAAGLALGTPGELSYASPPATTATSHTHHITTSEDTGTTPLPFILRSGGSGQLGLSQLTLQGNLIFSGPFNREIQASHALKLIPQDDLQIAPGGLVVYKDGQESRTFTHQDTVGGISGFRLFDLAPPLIPGNPTGNAMAFYLNTLKADNIYARKFIADEARVARGEWFLTYSFGIVETKFAVPAIGGTVDVWFEEAPGLGGFKLFVADHWILFRIIDIPHGIIAQSIWFQVVDADGSGTNDYIQRQDQIGEQLARQQWRLVRRIGGATDTVIQKGETGADWGLPPHMEGPIPVPGQGIVYLSSLHEDNGPFVQTQTFSAVFENVPQFDIRTRMGNLNGTLGYTLDRWGFATGVDLSKIPSSGEFIGAVMEATTGLGLYNTDLTMFTDNIEALKLTRAHGLAMRNDTVAFDDPLRFVAWFDDLDYTTSVPMTALGSYTTLNAGQVTRSLEHFVNTNDDGSIAQIVLRAIEGFTSAQAVLDMHSRATLSDGSTGSVISLFANESLARRLIVGSGITPFDPAILQVIERDSLINYKAGLTIHQQGAGDAVLHWYHQPSGSWFSMGIDTSSSPPYWKLSGSHTLGINDYIVIDPTTGSVTINGFDTGGSTPPSGMVGGDGINVAGSVISVKPDVARTSVNILAGPGLSGGGSLAATRTLSVLTPSASGLTVSASGVILNDSLAGDGLQMSLLKVLSVDTTVVRDPATVVRTSAIISPSEPITGGGVLVGSIPLGLHLASASGLSSVGGLHILDTLAGNGLDMAAGTIINVDNTVVRTTQKIITPLLGGVLGEAFLTGDVTLTVDTTVLRTDRRIYTDALGGLLGGDYLINDPHLAIDFTQVVPASRQIFTTDGLIGGGNLSIDRTLRISLSTPSGLLISGGSLEVANSIAGDGLLISGKVLSADYSKLVPTNRVLTAAQGLTGGGDLSANRSFDVGAGAGITVNADDVAVNQGFAFNWTGVQSWANTATFNGLVTMRGGALFDVGVFTFNTAPQLAANLNFVGARLITTSAGVNLTIAPDGDLVLDPAGLDVLPGGNRKIDLGDFNRKWDTLFASELYVETLVASSVMATIGGRVMVTPTSSLIADITSTSATTIDLKHNITSFVVGTYIYLESAPGGVPQIEAMKINSTATAITGGYRYTVIRGLNTTGAKTWLSGDAVASLGTNVGEGYIDLASVQTVKPISGSVQKLGPTITIYSRSAVTNWDDVAPVVSMGNLRSFVDYAGNQFGFATGNDLTLSPATGFSGITADRSNGIRLFNTDLLFYLTGVKTMVMDDSRGLGFRYQSIISPDYMIRWMPNLDTIDSQNESRLYAFRSGVDTFFRLAQQTTVGDTSLLLSSAKVLGGSSSIDLSNLSLEINNSSSGASQIQMQAGRIWLGAPKGSGATARSTLHIQDVGSAGSEAVSGLTVEAVLGGDAVLRLIVSTSGTINQAFSLGIDNSQGDVFKISGSSTLGTTDFVVIATTGEIGFGVTPATFGHFKRDLAGATTVRVENATNAPFAQAQFQVLADGATGQFMKLASAYGTYRSLQSGDTVLFNDSLRGNLVLHNDNASGTIRMTAGAKDIAHLSILSNGYVDINNTLASGGGGGGTLSFSLNAVVKGYIATPGAATQFITGSAIGDLTFRTEGGKMLWSADAGVTAHATLAPGTQFRINATGSNTPYFAIDRSGSLAGLWGVEGAANVLVSGSAAGDMTFRTQGGGMNWSVNGGASQNLSLSASPTFTAFYIRAMGTTTPFLGFAQNNVGTGFVGVEGAVNSLIQGSAVGDMILRSENKKILFSTNAGGHAAMQIAANGRMLIDKRGDGDWGLQILHQMGFGASGQYNLQEWSYSPASFSLGLYATVSSGLVRYRFALFNAGTLYDNMMNFDLGGVGMGNWPLSDTRLTLQEDSSRFYALTLVNRNATRRWGFAVDTLAVDDGIFALNDATAGVTRLVIDAAGSVGIGTAQPRLIEGSAKLTVQGADAGAVYASVINSGAGQVALALNRTGATPARWVMYIPAADDKLTFYNSISGAGNINFSTAGLISAVAARIGPDNAAVVATGSVHQVGAQDAHVMRATLYGSAKYTFVGGRALGSAAAPSALGSGNVIMTLGALGYTSGGWSTQSNGEISFRATEDYNGGITSKGGSEFLIFTRFNGATAASQAVRILHNGLFECPGVAGFNMGATGNPVYVRSDGLLGVQSSSMRFKRDIRPLPAVYGDDFMMALEPVIYKSNPPIVEGVVSMLEQTDHLGLIAERVDEVGGKMLVGYDQRGLPESLRYDLLTIPIVMAIQQLIPYKMRIVELEARLAELERRLPNVNSKFQS